MVCGVQVSVRRERRNIEITYGGGGGAAAWAEGGGGAVVDDADAPGAVYERANKQ